MLSGTRVASRVVSQTLRPRMWQIIAHSSYYLKRLESYPNMPTCDYYAFIFLTPSWTYESYFHFHSLSFFSSFSWGYFFKLRELRSHSTPTLNFKNSYYFLSFQSSNLPFKLKTLILCSFFIHKTYSHTNNPFSGSGLKYVFREEVID